MGVLIRKRYRVTIRGRNLTLLDGGKPVVVGCVATRFVDANSEIQAGEAAIAQIEAEAEIRGMRRQQMPSPAFAVEEVQQVAWHVRRFIPWRGFTFYQWDEGDKA